MSRRRSVGWPITLAVIMIVLLVALMIGWVVLALSSATLLAVGTTFLALVLIGVVLYLTIAVKQISLNQRQANFIDSVTHELKSPIASLKLYLQTLSRRTVSEAQQLEFYQSMLEDLDRLDTLINHMLDAARLEQVNPPAEVVGVSLADVLQSCASTVCLRHRLPAETIELDVAPGIVFARPVDLEIVFRNLLDNAVKYSMPHPQVRVESWSNGRGSVVTRVSDNGPGIPAKLRRKIFGRFVRLGSELERTQSGTGLGLYIVRTLVRRMKGKVSVRGRGTQSGTIFEVELPGHERMFADEVSPTEVGQPARPMPTSLSQETLQPTLTRGASEEE
ncbi:MAG TPA: HAMP domain-containing sensor histidine kinase [Pirellulales bacterium]|nr:HAMP domain-containing sensor histidine kinase [Pirellulales bacterium]